MALVSCTECNRQISAAAAACPGCGAKPPARTSTRTWILGGLFAVFVAHSIFSSNTSTPPAAPAKTPEQLAAEAKREAAFQRTVTIARALKAELRDPKSVDWESIRANDDASVICLEYRARNGFGGLNREFAVITPKKVSQKVNDWNKSCTGPLSDFKHARHVI